MRKTFTLKHSLIPILLTLLISTATADDQGWFNNSLTLKASSSLSIRFTQEIRHNELTLADAYLSNWSGGLVWTLSSRLTLGVSFLRETSLKNNGNLYENRSTLDAGYKLPLSEKTAIDLRFRTEIRYFEDDLAQDHLRMRLRVRIVTRLNLGKIIVKPFLALEPFADMTAGKINRNRVYAGAGFALTKQVEWTLNYIRQDTSGKDSLHIFNTGFDLKF